jgi:transcription antitermination factor NusA-like protein
MCENKLYTGQITKTDVDGSIILTKLAQKNHDIDKMTLIGSKEIDDEIILIFKSSDVRRIRSDIKLFELILNTFKKNVWIVESDSSDRRFLENLFYPILIDSVNFIWLPDGHKLTRVVLDKKMGSIKEKKVDTIKKICLSLRKIDLIIESPI